MEQARREGHAVNMDPRPESFGVNWLVEAWSDLNTDRQIGMDVGPIPFSAADRYARRLGLDDEEFDLLWACIAHLEEIHREDLARKRKRHGDNGKKRTHRH